MFKKLLIFLCCIIIVSVAFIAFSDIRSTKDYESLDLFDKTMFKELSKLYKVQKTDSNLVWNNTFNLNKLPLILVRARKDKGMLYSYSYLINVDGASDIFNAKEMNMNKVLGLPKVYKMGKLSLPSVKFLFPSNFGTTTINGQRVFYFKYNDNMISSEDPFWGFPTFMLHEAFHAYKQSSWDYDSGGDWILDYPFDIEQLSLLGLELNLTDTALTSKTPKDTQVLLKDIAILRTYRYKRWPQLIDETNSEAIEGTANYVEIKYAEAKNRITRFLLSSQLKKVTFMDIYNQIADGNVSPNILERTISYDRGAALCLLMDQSNIPWKLKIDKSKANGGKTQYQIIYDYFNMDKIDLDKEIERIKTLDDYKSYNTRASNIVNHAKSSDEK